MNHPTSLAPVSTPVALPSRPRFRWLLGISLLALLALRILCAFHYRVDSDEPQHLHVIWGVSKGFVQYQDIFDNHSPLFQMLCAPLFKALGERADIVPAMRMAMIPLFLAAWPAFTESVHASFRTTAACLRHSLSRSSRAFFPPASSSARTTSGRLSGCSPWLRWFVCGGCLALVSLRAVPWNRVLYFDENRPDGA